MNNLVIFYAREKRSYEATSPNKPLSTPTLTPAVARPPNIWAMQIETLSVFSVDAGHSKHRQGRFGKPSMTQIRLDLLQNMERELVYMFD
jgi:hypothetical protein